MILMMSKHYFLRTMVILLIISSFEMVSSCQSFERLEAEYWFEYTTSYDKGMLAYDSDTILETIRQGNQDAFGPIDDISKITPFPPVNFVEWSQSDFFLISEKLHEFIWGVSWHDWKVNHLFFRMDCEYADYGPQMFSIDIFKIVKDQQEDVRIIRVLDIKPLENLAYWSEYKKYPKREEWGVIDLSQLIIPIEEIFKRAELSGGNTYRVEVNNECTIFLTLHGIKNDEHTNGWLVRYVGFENDSPETGFHVVIDPLTGIVK